jgi:hypothetical protein
MKNRACGINADSKSMANTSTQSKLSESEFLRLEAEKAKAAIAESLTGAKEALADNVDPRAMTRRHPWLALGTAAIAGFVAVAVAVPSKEERELRHLERLHRAMHPIPPTPPPANTNGTAGKPTEKRSIGATILHELIQMIRPVLTAAITASIRAGANPPPPADSPQEGPDNPASM